MSNNHKDKTVWEKIAELPFSPEVINDLKSEVVMSVTRPTSHATLIAEGRRELAIELLARMGAL